MEFPEIKPRTFQEEADLSVLGPNVERLWTYGGVLTKSHNISCMTWNKKNYDILAVGYGEYGFTNQKSGKFFPLVWN